MGGSHTYLPSGTGDSHRILLASGNRKRRTGGYTVYFPENHSNPSGLLAAYIILLKRMGWSGLNESVSKSLKQAGVVLLITGAGGAFGAVIQATNIGEVLIAGLTEGQSSTMLILCLTFGIGVLFRVAQGQEPLLP